MQCGRPYAGRRSGQVIKTPFFITGLPRTRSAWLANLFTTDSTVCFHDPRATVTELIAGHPWLRVGVADSSLPLKAAAIMDRYPDAPWLFVKRDPDEAMRSFVRFTRDHVKLLHRELQRFWSMHAAASRRLLQDKRVFAIEFEDLHDAGVLSKAWEHLFPGVEFNAARLVLLQGLKVEQNIALRMSDFAAILGQRLAERTITREELANIK